MIFTSIAVKISGTRCKRAPSSKLSEVMLSINIVAKVLTGAKMLLEKLMKNG